MSTTDTARRQSAWTRYGSGLPAATWPSCKNMKSMSLCGSVRSGHSRRWPPAPAAEIPSGPAATGCSGPSPKDASISRRGWPRAPRRFSRPPKPARCCSLEPVRLDLEKGLVTRELFRRVAARQQRQTRLGIGFDFFDQVLHGRINWEQTKFKARKCRRGTGGLEYWSIGVLEKPFLHYSNAPLWFRPAKPFRSAPRLLHFVRDAGSTRSRCRPDAAASNAATGRRSPNWWKNTSSR